MANAVLKEDDGDEDREATRPLHRLAGSEVDSQLTAEDEDEDFEIVDTDSNFKPIHGERADGSEARLTEAEGGEKPLLEKRQQEQAQAQEQEAGKQRRDRAAERQRRRDGRQRTFQENADLRAQVALLQRQLGDITPRLSQIDQQRIQDQIGHTERLIVEQAQKASDARRKMSMAITAADPEAHTAALEEWEQAKQEGINLAAQKNRLSAAISEVGAVERQPNRQQGQPPQQQQEQERVNPLPQAAAEYVNDFRENHPWLRTDGQGRALDLDTDIMLRIDNAVAAEGFDPKTQDYWDEIEERGRQYLPHRFGGNTTQNTAQESRAPVRQNAQTQVAETRRGPMISGASERSGGNTNGNKVYLSPERKEALISVGALDRNGKTVLDKESYKKYMRAYQKWDRDNGTTV